jgi:adenosylcobinamide-GDP ribazoletransferase
MKHSGMPRNSDSPAPPGGLDHDDRLSWRSLPLDPVVTAIFMTRVPIPWRGRIGTPRLARAQWSLPVVGALIGGFAGLILWGGASIGLPALAAAFIAVGATALLTGALHEDGLADCADAFGGGQNKDQKLEILRDSRIGTYGGVALVCALGLRTTLFAALAASGWWAVACLAAAAAVSRGLIPAAMRISRPVRRDGLGTMAGIPSISVAATAGLLALAASLLVGWALIASLTGPVAGISAGLVALAAATVLAAAMHMLAWRQIGGYTGDVLGASQQVSELAFLAALVATL